MSYSIKELGDDARIKKQAQIPGEFETLRDMGFTCKGIGLDVGCGNGAYGVALASFFGRAPGDTLVGVDRHLNQNPPPYPGFEGDALFLRNLWRTPYFDFALARLSLRHSSEPVKILKQIRAVTKRGGQIIAIDTADSALVVAPYPHLWVPDRSSWFHEHGGNPDTGLSLAHYMHEAKIKDVQVRAVTLVAYDEPSRKAFVEVVLTPFLQVAAKGFHFEGIGVKKVLKEMLDRTVPWIKDPRSFASIPLYVAMGTK